MKAALALTPQSRLYAFQDLLGRVPDAKIAEMAGVSSSGVRSARLRLGIPTPAAEPEPAPTAESEECAEEAQLDEDEASAPAPSDDKEEEEQEEGPAPRPAEPTPRLVEVARSAWIDRFPPTGRPRRIGRGDVYRDDVARHLWEHHRALVRPYEA